jgi:soluble lytic murein transglycosylase-like protein
VRRNWAWLLLGAVGLAYVLRTVRSNGTLTTPTLPTAGSDATGFTSNPFAAVVEAVSSTLGNWKSVGEAATWLPVLNQTESDHGLPTDLLARIAYQESHFRESIIRGNTVSSAGALGIMQLMPQYFTSVRAPRPYSDGDVMAQIDEAATQLDTLYKQFGDWWLTIAAYNAGAGNVKKYGGIPPFPETRNYVAQVTADVPALSA